MDTDDNILNSTEQGSVPISIVQDKRLNINDIRIYVYLKIRQGLSSYTFPKINTIVTDTMISRSTVFRTLKRLEKYGWVSRTPRDGRSNYYKCNVIPFNAFFTVSTKKNRIKKSRVTNDNFIEFKKKKSIS
jgi:DNA-binding MarR family transcriptional regulator